MTKKDYERIGRALYQAKPILEKNFETWEGVVEEVGWELEEDYPKFDREKFERLCLTGSTKKS